MQLPPFVVIEGNIGAGKTTLATMLAAEYNRRLILEKFSDNPFLPLFYREPERYAFPVEVFFMAERHRQLEAELTTPELFTQGTIADYLFIKTLLFARNSLGDQEYRLFTRLFRALDVQFPDPDLIVYLHRPIEQLRENIRRRGREFEQSIGSDYLLAVQRTYFEYFRTLRETPVLVLDLGERDFRDGGRLFTQIGERLAATYRPGVTTVEMG